MKKLLSVLFMFCLFTGLSAMSFANTRVLNFCEQGNRESNEILKRIIEKEFEQDDFEVVSYYYDLDADGQNEILGIIKTNLFYSLAGYKLIALKLDSTGYWNLIESDVYFDETKNLEIHGKKIKYHGTVLYKHKKYTAKIKKDRIIANKSFFDRLNDKKARGIEEVSVLEEGSEKIKIDLESLPRSTQKNADFYYNGLSERTKHYLK